MSAEPSIQQARAAKPKALQMLQDRKLEASIGISRVGEGFGLKVNLQQPLADADALPQHIDGVPIRVEVVGQIRKR